MDLLSVLVLYNAVHSMCASKELAQSTIRLQIAEKVHWLCQHMQWWYDEGKLKPQLVVVQCALLGMVIGCN